MLLAKVKIPSFPRNSSAVLSPFAVLCNNFHLLGNVMLNGCAFLGFITRLSRSNFKIDIMLPLTLGARSCSTYFVPNGFRCLCVVLFLPREVAEKTLTNLLL